MPTVWGNYLLGYVQAKDGYYVETVEPPTITNTVIDGCPVNAFSVRGMVWHFFKRRAAIGNESVPIQLAQ